MLNEKTINLRLLKNNIILLRYSRNPNSGLLTTTSPYVKLPVSFDSILIQKLKFLMKFNEDKFLTSIEDLKAETGYTFRQLEAKGVKSISFRFFEKNYQIIPEKRHQGGGFSPLNSKMIEIGINSSDEEILYAIKNCLENCL